MHAVTTWPYQAVRLARSQWSAGKPIVDPAREKAVLMAIEEQVEFQHLRIPAEQGRRGFIALRHQTRRKMSLSRPRIGA